MVPVSMLVRFTVYKFIGVNRLKVKIERFQFKKNIFWHPSEKLGSIQEVFLNRSLLKKVHGWGNLRSAL